MMEMKKQTDLEETKRLIERALDEAAADLLASGCMEQSFRSTYPKAGN